MLTGRRWVAALAITAALSAPRPDRALAQTRSAIDEGVRLYGEAEFEGALAALERAELGPLDRHELLRLLATRALVQFALGDFERLERDLLAIVSIEPDYDLGVRAPPPLQNALRRARRGADERLSIGVRLEPTPNGVRVAATTRGDRAGIVQRISVYARRAGSGAFTHGDGGRVEVTAPPQSEVELFASAMGPGGAVLATEGTEDAPRRMRAPEPLPATAGDDGPSPALWLGLGIGLAGAAAIAIVLAFVFGGSNETRPVGPFVVR